MGKAKDKTIRADVLQHGMNVDKISVVKVLISLWRREAKIHLAIQKQYVERFGKQNQFPEDLPKDKRLMTGRYSQACKQAVKGALDGWLAIISDKFVAFVQRQDEFDLVTKRYLLLVNSYNLWHDTATQFQESFESRRYRSAELSKRKEAEKQRLIKAGMKEADAVEAVKNIEAIPSQADLYVPLHLRQLARQIRRNIIKKNRFVNVNSINLMLDQRLVDVFCKKSPQERQDEKVIAKLIKVKTKTKAKAIESPETERPGPVEKPVFTIAESAGHFKYWLSMTTLEHGKKLAVPLFGNEHFATRQGSRCKTIQLNQSSNGELVFAMLTDVKATYQALTAAYVPELDIIGIDFGLNTMIATSVGELFGRNFMGRLKWFDNKIQTIASRRQSHGLRVTCRSYRALVKRLRGYLKTEICRILNLIVQRHKPKTIAVERLNFQNGGLSKRLNRLAGNCGRSIMNEKLADLSAMYGIEIVEVNSAYSSQECDKCHYVARSNRKGDLFRCGNCGATSHSDIKAARTVVQRAVPGSSGYLGTAALHYGKKRILALLTGEYCERHPWPRGGSGDCRYKNAYYRDWVVKNPIAVAGCL